jgi:hypothetical protein
MRVGLPPGLCTAPELLSRDAGGCGSRVGLVLPLFCCSGSDMVQPLWPRRTDSVEPELPHECEATDGLGLPMFVMCSCGLRDCTG